MIAAHTLDVTNVTNERINVCDYGALTNNRDSIERAVIANVSAVTYDASEDQDLLYNS